MKKTGRKRGLITMRDVAQATGFSPATVSIVLNNAPLARYIASTTRQRIEETAKRLGYRPNAMARFLRSKRSQSIGVMLFDVTDPFCTPILRGIENALYPLGYLPIFADAHNQRDRFERYLEMLLERHVDGLIVVANWLFVDIHVLADLNKQEIPAATILAFDDLTALGAMRALAKAGVNVPEQCSVTGFDDVAISALSAPSLTTVRQPLETMGGTAVSIVMDAIKAGHENRDWAAVSPKLHPELVIRDSTRGN